MLFEISCTRMYREMMDSMQDAGKYDWAFGLGFMYSYMLTVPHSVAVNLAFPDEIALQGKVCSLLLSSTCMCSPAANLLLRLQGQLLLSSLAGPCTPATPLLHPCYTPACTPATPLPATPLLHP